MHVHPCAIGTPVQRDRRVLGQSLGKHRRRTFRPRPVHAHRRQRRLRQAGMRSAAAAVAPACDQPGHHTDSAEPGRQPAGKRHAHEYRARAVAGLLVQQSKPRQHQGLARRRLDQRMPARPASDRRHHQARIQSGQRRIVQSMCRGLRRGEVMQQHVGAHEQSGQRRLAGGRIQVEREPLLAAVEYREQDRIGIVRHGGRLDPDHLRAGLGQLQSGRRSRDATGEFDHPDLVENRFVHHVPGS